VGRLFFSVLTANAIILRRNGYRWRTPPISEAFTPI
jgi:hypothetical protein